MNHCHVPQKPFWSNFLVFFMSSEVEMKPLKPEIKPFTLSKRVVIVLYQKVSERYEIYRLRAFNTTQGGSRQMLRSIKKAFDIIKAEDAETAITVHTIRTWCKQGKIKCLTAGNKVLVDMQSLLDYIAIKEEK